MWMRGIRTNCLMKVHFARHELHHVDLMGGAAPVHSTPCHVFILAANVGLTGLQFYWTKLILEGLAAKLAESDASAKPKSRAKSPAKGLKGA